MYTAECGSVLSTLAGRVCADDTDGADEHAASCWSGSGGADDADDADGADGGACLECGCAALESSAGPADGRPTC